MKTVIGSNLNKGATVEYNVIPFKDNKLILCKQWIDERKASFDEESHILQSFSFDVCYQLKVKSQKPTPMVQSTLEENKKENNPLSLGIILQQETLEPSQSLNNQTTLKSVKRRNSKLNQY